MPSTVASFYVCSSSRTNPNNFISKVLITKYFVQYNFGVVAHVPVEVDVDGAIFGQQVAEEQGRFVEPLQIGIEAPTPSVAVGLLLDHAGLFHKAAGRRSVAFALLPVRIGFGGGVGGGVVKEKLAPVSNGGSI